MRKILKSLDWLHEDLIMKGKCYYYLAEKFLEPNHGGMLLDVGCGGGDFISYLTKTQLIKRGFVGLDPSNEELNTAKKTNITVVKAVATFLPFKNNSFENISALEMIEHLGSNENITKTFNEFYRVLQNDGVLIISTPNKGKLLKYAFLDPGFWFGKHRHFSIDELDKMIRNIGFEIQEKLLSGGLIYVIFYYVLYWRARKYGLLRFSPVRAFWQRISKLAQSEYQKANIDGCTIILKARKSNKI